VARATSPVVAVVLLTALTVAIAAGVGAVVPAQPAEPPPVADLELSVDAESDRIAVAHRGGDALPPDALNVTVRVDGEPLVHQPPIPFFAARGFRSGPTGPFNPATSGDWQAGQTASFRLASTNAPAIQPGDRVDVTIATERAVLAVLETTAT
jgi:FlaG/FlaF family flagellin (archaellin)